jgi:PhzF family phenazine biosynthesis protein
MQLPIYQVDAFATEVFRGNPAAICPLDEWLPTELMQSIAAENNLAETAFFVGSKGRYHLRWFTPAVEVDLCGHATLASAHVIFRFLEPRAGRVAFETRSGTLAVARDGESLSMDFPALPPRPAAAPAGLTEGIGCEPREVLLASNYLALLDTEAQVRALQPDFVALKRCLGNHGLIVTAPGEEYDFVSRFFAPNHGIDEDPVTGSAHCTLAPYWSATLGKRSLRGYQASARGGEVRCEDLGDRVRLTGTAVLYLTGIAEIGSELG